MAVTSIWRVNGNLKGVINYIKNPDKTTLDTILSYATDEKKTTFPGAKEQTELKSELVSGINCYPETAAWEMQSVKRHFGKEDGVLCYHGYQSFAPGESNPKEAHEIGMKLARRLWGERHQVVVATHLDRSNHLHTHFVLNTVSFVDGIKYYRSQKDYTLMQKTSDALCREYGLSVIQKKDGKQKHYAQWQAEQEGKPTYRTLMQRDVDQAIREAGTQRQFFDILRKQGYEIKIGKDITLRPRHRERGLKLCRNFGEAYSREAICHRILTEQPEGREKPRTQHSQDGAYASGPDTFFKIHLPIDNRSQNMLVPANHSRTLRLENVRQKVHRPKKRITGIKALYLRYCYQMGILVRRAPDTKLHLLYREDLKHIGKISNGIKLLCRLHIETAGQLALYQGRQEAKIEQRIKERDRLYYQKRKEENDGAKSGRMETGQSIQEEIRKQNEELKILRKEVKLCRDIRIRSESMRANMIRAEAETGSRDRQSRDRQSRDGPGREKGEKDDRRRRCGRPDRKDHIGER